MKSKNLLRYAYLLVGPLLIAGGAMHARSASRQASDRSQPAETFVPFSAQTEITTETGQIILGRFYRRGDGSTRSETGPALDAPTVIYINNHANRTSYMWAARDGGWISYPLEGPQLPPWHPDEKSLALMTPVSESVDGLELLRKKNGPNGYSLLAPALGYYAVVNTTCSTDSRAEAKCSTNRKFNIRVGEPPWDLFEPAEGERIAKSTVPFAPRRPLK